MNTNINDMQRYLEKWQAVLRLMDWDIRLQTVATEWRKTGDIKIDIQDKNAILLVNVCNPKHTNLEEVIIHELLHLKLWGMDQTIERLIGVAYGENDLRHDIVYDDFMLTLETTVHDLTKSFLALHGEDKALSFGRLDEEVEKELKEL